MSKNIFKLKSSYFPAGDQPEAIKQLLEGLEKGYPKQTLLGATGTGKTFTIANVIAKWNKPTLVIAHNKTLAAQLAQEFREFFPDSAVHYFVSYYDYYQPEAYMPVTDTYIEKDAQINKEIDRLRHATTQALLTRKDVIIVASVSCIYGLGSPKDYEKVNLKLAVNMKMTRNDLMKKLIEIHFERTNSDISPGQFRSIGQKVEIMPISEIFVYQIEFERDAIEKITKVDPVSSKIISDKETNIFLFPAKHFITEKNQLEKAIKNIKAEMQSQLKKFEKEGKLLEAERIKRRTTYDLAMIREIGYCNGIENYSRQISGKKEGEPPETLLSYFPHLVRENTLRHSHSVLEGQVHSGRSEYSSEHIPEPDFLTIIDESHVTLPQLQGMYAGDASRKNTLIEFGFRLPSARDNRPLKYDEFEKRIGQVIYTSATPGKYELEESKKSCEQTCPVGNRISKKSVVSCGVVEQIIRPTGLVDPEIIVKPVSAIKDTDLSKKNRLSLSLASLPRPSRHGLGGARAHTYDFFSTNTSASDYGGQIQDFIIEADQTVKKGYRVLATTLTKKMAEDLSLYLKEQGLKAEYLHSEIKTIERIQILSSFRRGDFDVLVGVNLLREGLDLPEVALIGIFDADKEGFLRSETSLIQIIGRAARNAFGRVILYADIMTKSLEKAINETNRRRSIQQAYNKKHGITPQTIIKKIKDITEDLEDKHKKAVGVELSLDLEIFKKSFSRERNKKSKTEREELKHSLLSDEEINNLIYEKILKMKEKEMNKAVRELDFETAAILRDEIIELKSKSHI